jgi:hypothetical protein
VTLSDAILDCGSCQACCHQLVLLTDNDLTRGPWHTDPDAPAPMLQRQTDDSCIYLDPILGCTVYSRRPDMCRAFHCGRWFNTLTPTQRRDFELDSSALLRAGEKHANDP